MGWLDDAGNMQGVRPDRGLIHEDKPGRERLICTKIEHGESDQKKSPFTRFHYTVAMGPESGYEFRQDVYCGPRKPGSEQGAIDMAIRYWKGFLASQMADAEADGYLTGYTTSLDALVGRLATLCGKPFSAMVGIEKGGEGFRDKQVVKAWIAYDKQNT